jgi:hypothetical protein
MRLKQPSIIEEKEERMRFKSNPKQKSSYPGLLESFEKNRQRDWLKAKINLGVKQSFRGKFSPSARKSP